MKVPMLQCFALGFAVALNLAIVIDYGMSYAAVGLLLTSPIFIGWKGLLKVWRSNV